MVEKEIEKFGKNLNNIFKFIKLMLKDSKDVEGNQYIRDKRGRKVGFVSNE